MSASTHRTIYLKTLPVAEALEKSIAALDRNHVSPETVPAQEAAGRVSSAPVYARYSSPTQHSAAMDGIAVRAADTFTAREGHPVTLRKVADGLMAPGSFIPVNTGNPLPLGCDAVIMIEHVHYPKQSNPEENESVAVLEVPAFPWQHVRRIGEDIVATELLFPRNHVFSAYDVGALLSGGIWDVPVWEKLRIRIIPTGDEVLDFMERPEPRAGQVIESNSQMLAALAVECGCLVERIAPVPDVPELLQKAVQESLDAGIHITLLCAGSSAGSKDFSRSVIAAVGTVLVHGIAVMPGKPSLLGEAGGRLLVGVPGYPVSAAVCFEQLLEPLIAWLSRKPQRERHEIPVYLARKTSSRLGTEEILRLCVGQVGDKFIASPLGRGAGNITTLAKAQAVAIIAANSEGEAEGTQLTARLLTSTSQLRNTLVCIGSHDNILDLLADALNGLDTPFSLVSSHVGSMGGISALKNASCHMAGMHLFDPESQDFNIPFLHKYLPQRPLSLLTLAVRHQGFIVATGNPKKIQGIESLRDATIRCINRQRGAGTRILFDYHLQQAGIEPEQVQGYGHEEYTHMAVAVNILAGTADCGLGIKAAADALGLDFVPLATERYELAIPQEFLDDPRIKAVLALANSDAFRQRIQQQGGYETALTGQLRTV